MKRRTLRLSLLLMMLLATAAGFVCPRLSDEASAAPQARRSRAQRRRAPARPRVDYTKFSHQTAAHRRGSCASCHQSPSDNWAQARPRESAFPDVTDYPEHASCLGCHRQQFFRGARPAICSVCHTVVSPRAGDRHAFENPAAAFARSEKAKTRPREFALHFPHDVHQDVMARAPRTNDGAPPFAFARASFRQETAQRPKPNSCSICHETYRPQAAAATPTPAAGQAADAGGALPAGLLKTTPTGHDSCFNCHWQDGGEKPFSSDCAGCHKLLPQPKAPAPPAGRDADAALAARAGFAGDPFVLRKLLRRDTVKFPHDEENHRAIDCATCHTRIASLSTLDERTLKVPILSCGGGSSCHISARPKKILNEEVDKKLADASFQCAKCHANLGREKPPKSHLDAVGK